MNAKQLLAEADTLYNLLVDGEFRAAQEQCFKLADYIHESTNKF